MDETKVMVEELRAHLHEHPFVPIRVFISDGAYYDVHHPDFMLVSRAEVVIGLDPGDDRFPERNAYLDPIHITRTNRSTAAARNPRGPNAVPNTVVGTTVFAQGTLVVRRDMEV